MKLTNLVHNTNPIFVHNNGRNMPDGNNLLFQNILNQLRLDDYDNDNRKYKTHDVIDIVCYQWGEYHRTTSIFSKSINRIGYYSNVLTPNSKFKPRFMYDEKIFTTLEFLKTSKKEYVLGCDSLDVVVIENIEKIINMFDSYHCGILFAAEIGHHPFYTTTKQFELEKSEFPFCFLNAGCFMARKHIALELFRKAWKFYPPRLKTQKTKLNISHRDCCDQEVWKYLYQDLFPLIRIDNKCKVFQCLYKSKEFLQLENV